MRFTVLGSGTGVPHPTRQSSGYFVETDEAKMLLDCSASIGSRMAAAGIAWHELDAIWISHFHLDHVGGLAPFLAGTKHAAEMRERTKPLKIVGPHGVEELFDKFDAAYPYKLREQPFPLEFIEVGERDAFVIGDLECTPFKTPHTPESHAIHIRSGEKTIFYTADTGIDPSLASFGKGVDLFVIEASFPFEKPGPKHLTLAEAMFMIHNARPKRAVITHLYPDWDAVDIAGEIAKLKPACEVTPAFDGMVIDLG